MKSLSDPKLLFQYLLLHSSLHQFWLKEISRAVVKRTDHFLILFFMYHSLCYNQYLLIICLTELNTTFWITRMLSWSMQSFTQLTIQQEFLEGCYSQGPLLHIGDKWSLPYWAEVYIYIDSLFSLLLFPIMLCSNIIYSMKPSITLFAISRINHFLLCS